LTSGQTLECPVPVSGVQLHPVLLLHWGCSGTPDWSSQGCST